MGQCCPKERKAQEPEEESSQVAPSDIGASAYPLQTFNRFRGDRYEVVNIGSPSLHRDPGQQTASTPRKMIRKFVSSICIFYCINDLTVVH